MGRICRPDPQQPEGLLTPLGCRDSALHALVALQAERARMLDGLRSGIVDLALAMARQIVNEAVQVNPDVLERMYRSALETVSSMSPGVIRVHPDGIRDTDVLTLAAELGFAVAPDGHLAVTDYRIEADSVTVDGRLSSALTEMARVLKKPVFSE